MKDYHKEKLENIIEGVKDAARIFGDDTGALATTIFKAERMLARSCPDCGRGREICANTMSKCSISPNNTTEEL